MKQQQTPWFGLLNQPSAASPLQDHCRVCQAPALFKCPHCKQKLYCCENHMKQNKAQHKQRCSGQQGTNVSDLSSVLNQSVLSKASSPIRRHTVAVNQSFEGQSLFLLTGKQQKRRQSRNQLPDDKQYASQETGQRIERQASVLLPQYFQSQ